MTNNYNQGGDYPGQGFNPQGGVPPAQRRLVRSSVDSWVGGVLGGIGATYNIDATLLRLVFILATALTGGTLIVAYLIAWIIMPTV